MFFSYTAIGSDGKRTTGTDEAKDQYDLGRALKARGITLLSAEKKKERSLVGAFLPFLGRVKTADKIVFTKNLSAMTRAGLSLSRSLAILEKQTKSEKFKTIIGRVSETVERGGTLSEGLAAHPRAFPALLSAMVKAGEESGGLSDALSLAGSQMEKSYLLAKKIRGALLYPGIIITAMIVVGILMLIFVVPTLTSAFKELGVALPASTRAIIAVSDFLAERALLSLGMFIVFFFAVWGAFKSRAGKHAWESFVLRVPVIGELVRKTNAARTGRTLSSLLSAGVAMTEALRITGEVVQNFHFRKVLAEAGERVQKGEPLSLIFKENEVLYPPLVGEMTEVGEETGKLTDMLVQVAVFYETEVEEATRNLSTIIEPFLMVVVGITVGFFAVSMIAPTYSLLDSI